MSSVSKAWKSNEVDSHLPSSTVNKQRNVDSSPSLIIDKIFLFSMKLEDSHPPFSTIEINNVNSCLLNN